MTTTPQQIAITVATSATDLYAAFVGAAPPTRAMITSLNFCNTTTSDITIDVWLEPAGGGVNIHLYDDVVVPAKGVLEWRGLIVLDASTEKIQAQASAAGVDCLGAVMENA
jgi:hypothetical protein